MRLTRFGLVLGLVLLSAVSVASAQGSLDLVELSNGGFVRGTVLVYEPGQPVVVQLPNGTTRTLQPNDVARVRMGGAAAPSPAPSARPSAPAAPPSTPAAPSSPPVVAPPAQAAPAVVPAASAPGDDAARRLVSAPPAESGAWRLDDGRDGEEDWVDLTERDAYRPRGVVHFGVAGGIGVVSAFGWLNSMGTGFGAEVAAVLDIRPVETSLYRLRFEAVLGAVAHQSGFRIPYLLRVFVLGLDLHDWVVWRLGGEIGGHTGRVFGAGTDGLYTGPVTELALTPADRHLEIGVLFGVPFALSFQSAVSFQATARVSYLF